MAAQVAAYRAANGTTSDVETWNATGGKNCTLPIHQNPAIVVGEIDVQDSKDVIFDDVTVFEGPVTVERVRVEDDDDAAVAPSQKAAKEADLGETSSDPCGFGSCAFRWAIGLAIVALVVIAVTATLVSSYGEPKVKDKEGDVYDGNELVLVKRDQWGGRPFKHPPDPLTLPVPFVIVSHTATEHCNSLHECSDLVRSVQSFHMESRGWWDIGYNFLVGGDGRAYEARGWDAVGAHTLSYNNVSIGLSFIGTFTDHAPPPRQVSAALKLVQEGVRLGKVGSKYALLAHRQVSPTESPGEKLYEMMQEWPHWTEVAD